MKLHKMVAQELGLTWVRHLGNQVHVFKCPGCGEEQVIRILVAWQYLDDEQEPAPREDYETITTPIPDAFRRAFDGEQDQEGEECGDEDEVTPEQESEIQQAIDEILRRRRDE